jgi:hypothetical protein
MRQKPVPGKNRRFVKNIRRASLLMLARADVPSAEIGVKRLVMQRARVDLPFQAVRRTHSPAAYGPDGMSPSATHDCRADKAKPQTTAPPRSCSAYSRDERWSIGTLALPAFLTAANRDLHHRIMPQPVEVDRVLVAARDRRRTRHHDPVSERRLSNSLNSLNRERRSILGGC